MGLYIKGLRLPKKGRYTSFTVYSDGRVVYKFGGDRAGQAVEVPAHGRLIDEIDARRAFYSVYQEHGLPWKNAEVILETCPTIVPSEVEYE